MDRSRLKRKTNMDRESEQVNNSRPISVEAVQFGTKFLDLNDYCLLKVFRSLDLLDMINIRFTCKRFHVVSEMAAHKFNDFCMADYVCEIKRRKLPITALHFDRVMGYIHPVVKSIRSYGHYLGSRDHDGLLQEMEKYDFPKLKSLCVRVACHLNFIKNKNIEVLDIDNVKSGDLNIYFCGITKLKELRFNAIRECMPLSELLNFFDNNPNIERLVFLSPSACHLPSDFFSHLKYLTMFEYRLGSNFRDLETLLQIENLTELALERRCDGSNPSSLNTTVENFLTSMVQKQTLKKIDLRNVYFDNLVSVLAPLNLVSLRYVGASSYLVPRLAVVPFPTLKYLDVNGPFDIKTIATLIKHLTALEDIQFSTLKPNNRQTILEQLTQLLSVRCNRPELQMHFLTLNLKIKIFFKLGCYEIKEEGRLFAAVVPQV